jgi:hypothetical protein
VRLDRNDRINTKPQSVVELVETLPKKAFRRFTWREETKAKLSSRLSFVRVKTTHDDGIPLAKREPQWLVALFPSRPPGRVRTVRSTSRPERHFADPFITARLAIALYLARWLPLCPFCHRPHAPSRYSRDRFTRLE